MEFLTSYLIFLMIGFVLLTGFGGFLYSLNYIIDVGTTWWAGLIMGLFLGGLFIAILTWCIRNHRQEKKKYEM